MRVHGRVLLACLALPAACIPVGVSGFSDDAAAAADSPAAADDRAAASDAGAQVSDAAPASDRGAPPADAASPMDLGVDAASPSDATSPSDAATAIDATPAADAPAIADRGAPSDAPVATDRGAPSDLPPTADAPAPADATAPLDAPSPADATAPLDRPTAVDAPAPVDVPEVQPVLPPAPPFGYAPLMVTRRRLDGSGTLIDDRRYVYAYDTMRRLDTLDEQVPAVAPAWRTLTRLVFRYAVDGRLDRTETSTPDGPAWNPLERVRYEYDAAGQRSVEHHEVPPSGTSTTWVENWRYVWEWTAGRPTWRRFWQVPSGGGALYYSTYQAFSYEADGRLRGLGRGDRGSPTGSFSDTGGFTYVAWSNGALRAYDFRRGSRTSHADYLYGANGHLRDVTFADGSHTAYLYDARGRLQFVRSYGSDGEGGIRLAEEFELAHTDAGSSHTFALDPHPLNAWMTDTYGRGDVLDRYRR